MTIMMNKVNLIGRLTQDPTLKKTTNGTSVCNFTIAVNRLIAKQGQQEADFINCVTWNKTAENMNTYLSKGSLIGVTGHLGTRTYEKQNGDKVYITEVLVEQIDYLETKKKEQNQGYANGTQPTSENQGYYEDTLNIASDDLPF